MKLLVVDYEFFARQGIMDGVNWDVLPYDEVFQAASYTEAVEILTRNQIDVVLCDIEMPDESGLELIAWVNENKPGTVSIILSCHDEFDFARQAVSLSCMEYILKPARYDVITDALRRAGEKITGNHQKDLYEGYGKMYVDNLVASKKEESGDVVENVADYINRHLEENLSVSVLANMVYVSPDHLTRSFKKRYKMTVREYILERRMKLAAELLKDKGLTITMVADFVGFGNYSYFTEQFKKYYGMTPRDYQNGMRKDSK